MTKIDLCHNKSLVQHTLLEEMVLFRTRNPRFIYGTPKWFYRTIFFFFW